MVEDSKTDSDRSNETELDPEEKRKDNENEREVNSIVATLTEDKSKDHLDTDNLYEFDMNDNNTSNLQEPNFTQSLHFIQNNSQILNGQPNSFTNETNNNIEVTYLLL